MRCSLLIEAIRCAIALRVSASRRPNLKEQALKKIIRTDFNERASYAANFMTLLRFALSSVADCALKLRRADTDSYSVEVKIID